METRGVHIPSRTANRLCSLFLRYFTAVHIESAPAIRALLERQGGYVLILDGTGHHGPMVMQMRDGWSGMQLLASSVKSAGWKLFEPIYPGFRSRIERRGLKKRLHYLMRVIARGDYTGRDSGHTLEQLKWIFEYRKDGKGMAYPFSLPALDFYIRCEKVRCGMMEKADMQGQRRGNAPGRLLVLLNRLHPPPKSIGSIQSDAEALLERMEWFDRTRRVLRYRNGPIPLSTKHTLSDKELEKGRRRLDWLHSMIGKELDIGGGAKRREFHRVLRSIDGDLMERRDELLAPNVIVQSECGRVIRPLPRTISSAETEFRRLRRHSRRITGNAQVDDQVQNDGPGMLLLDNLKNGVYVREVYGSISNLPKRFSTVSQKSLEDAKKILRCSGTNE